MIQGGAGTHVEAVAGQNSGPGPELAGANTGVLRFAQDDGGEGAMAAVRVEDDGRGGAMAAVRVDDDGKGAMAAVRMEDDGAARGA